MNATVLKQMQELEHKKKLGKSTTSTPHMVTSKMRKVNSLDGNTIGKVKQEVPIQVHSSDNDGVAHFVTTCDECGKVEKHSLKFLIN